MYGESKLLRTCSYFTGLKNCRNLENQAIVQGRSATFSSRFAIKNYCVWTVLMGQTNDVFPTPRDLKTTPGESYSYRRYL